MQLDLPMQNNPEGRDLRREADRFMADHPQVLELFERYALEMARTGQPFGMKLIAERVRWEVQTTWAADDRGFKLNNNHTAYIARALIEEHPWLAGLIRLRGTVY